MNLFDRYLTYLCPWEVLIHMNQWYIWCRTKRKILISNLLLFSNRFKWIVDTKEIFIINQTQWLVPNKLLVNPPVAKPRENNSRLKPRANPRRRLAVSRNRTDIDRVPLRWERFGEWDDEGSCVFSAIFGQFWRCFSSRKRFSFSLSGEA